MPPKSPVLQFFERHYKPMQIKGKNKSVITALKIETEKRNPDEKKLARLYSKLAHFQNSLQPPDFLEHQVKQLLSLAKFQSADNIASIGSGAGMTEAFLAKNAIPNGAMTCIDFVHGMSKRAKATKAMESARNMRVITASGARLPLKSGTQDFVIAIQSNMPNTSLWGNVLGEARRVLKNTKRARLIFTILPPEKKKEEQLSGALAELRQNGFQPEVAIRYGGIAKYHAIMIVSKPTTIFG